MNTAGELLNDKHQEMITVPADTTIHETVRIMVEKNIGAILVESGGQIAGIWTERDLLRNSLQAGFDPVTALIGDYMTTSLHSAPWDSPLIRLQEMLLGLFIRHLLIERDGQYVGLLSIGDILRAILLEKDDQVRELNAIASWEYYDNWKWDRKKR